MRVRTQLYSKLQRFPAIRTSTAASINIIIDFSHGLNLCLVGWCYYMLCGNIQPSTSGDSPSSSMNCQFPCLSTRKRRSSHVWTIFPSSHPSRVSDDSGGKKSTRGNFFGCISIESGALKTICLRHVFASQSPLRQKRTVLYMS